MIRPCFRFLQARGGSPLVAFGRQMPAVVARLQELKAVGALFRGGFVFFDGY
jgi:hypothetical protein